MSWALEAKGNRFESNGEYYHWCRYIQMMNSKIEEVHVQDSIASPYQALLACLQFISAYHKFLSILIVIGSKPTGTFGI